MQSTDLATIDAPMTPDLPAPVVSSPLPVFRGEQMAQALVAYKDLQRALDQAMPDQIMQIADKQFRKKGYWRAVAVAFNLTVEPIAERRDVNSHFEDGRENFGYAVTYRATAPGGRFATGDGACFAVEKSRKFKCPHPEREGSRRTLHYPAEACPDFDPAFQWRAISPEATEHNVRSHAHTRAFNRAVSNLVGFGEVSAEEIERDDREDRAPESKAVGASATPQAREQAKPKNGNSGAVISEAQRKRMYAIAMNSGWTQLGYRAYLQDNYGIEDDRQTPRSKYEAICADFESAPGDDVPF
jgi:hypothetical protein